METLETLLMKRECIQNCLNDYSNILKSYPRGNMGLVKEESKDGIFYSTKALYDTKFQMLRNINTKINKDFKKEYKEYRRNKMKKV